MPVPHSKNTIDHGKTSASSQKTNAAQNPNGSQQVSTRTGKESDAIYREEKKLLDEVKEKYKEADLEAQREVEKALGSESKSKSESKFGSELAEVGVVIREEQASDLLKNGKSFDLPMTEDKYEVGKKAGFSGKRLINGSIVGVSSIAAMAVYVTRLIKIAHKHAKKVIFKNADKEG